MKYTINGKEYSEFDINKRCAELMGFKVLDSTTLAATQHKSFRNVTLNTCWIAVNNKNNSVATAKYNPCTNPSYTWPIIEKYWDKLAGGGEILFSNWHRAVQKHKCTKLVAACICFIESSEVT